MKVKGLTLPSGNYIYVYAIIDVDANKCLTIKVIKCPNSVDRGRIAKTSFSLREFFDAGWQETEVDWFEVFK